MIGVRSRRENSPNRRPDAKGRANRIGAFAGIVSDAGCVWDTSQLYDTGVVTLLAVPETGAIWLFVLGMGLVRRRRKSIVRT